MACQEFQEGAAQKERERESVDSAPDPPGTKLTGDECALVVDPFPTKSQRALSSRQVAQYQNHETRPSLSNGAGIRFTRGASALLFVALSARRESRLPFPSATGRDGTEYSNTRKLGARVASRMQRRGDASRRRDVPSSGCSLSVSAKGQRRRGQGAGEAPFHPLNYEISHGKFFSRRAVRKFGRLPATRQTPLRARCEQRR